MKRIIASSIFFIALTGCSSIISKSEYAVAIDSAPSSARFVIENKNGKKVHSGVTPTTVTLKSSAGYFIGEEYTILFTKKGYSEKTHTISSTLDGWYIGNLVFGGPIGLLVVDPATGAMYNLPKRVDVSLTESTRSSQTQKNAPGELKIATLDTLSEAEKKRLVKIK